MVRSASGTTRLRNSVSTAKILPTVSAAFHASSTIRPLKKGNQPFSAAFLYLSIICTLKLTFSLLVGFVQSERSQMPYEKIFHDTAIGILILFAASLIVPYVIVLYSKLPYDGYILLLFVSSCTYCPLCVLVNEVLGEFSYFIKLLISLLMAYYVQSSLEALYIPVDQRDSTIFSLLAFVGALTVVYSGCK